MLEQYVDQYYVMDPKTEKVLHNGNELRNGMKVLIESPDVRENINPLGMSSYNEDRARKLNRWCVVSGVRIGRPKYSIEVVEFVGLYEDGTQRKIEIGASLAWLVKLDSLQKSDKDKYTKVLELVQAAMGYQDGATYNGVANAPDVEEFAKTTAKSIIEVFR